MGLPSGSKLQLAMKCAGSFLLPAEKNDDPEGRKATEGKIIHEYIALFATDGLDAADQFAQDCADEGARLAIKDIDLGVVADVLRRGSYKTYVEVPHSINTKLMTFWSGKSWDPLPGKMPNDIRGIADLVMYNDFSNVVYVVDWKTGNGEIEPAKTNAQLMLMTEVLRDATVFEILFPGKVKKIEGVCRLIVNPMTGEKSEFYCSVFEKDYDLEKFDTWIRSVPGLELLNNAWIQDGPHCRYCPAFVKCPRQANMIELLNNGIKVDDQTAGSVYERINNMKRAIYSAERELEEYVQIRGEIKLPSGETLRMEAVPTEKVDLFKAYTTIKHHDPDINLNDMASTTVNKLRAAFKGDVRAKMKLLRNAGAVYKEDEQKLVKVKRG